MRFSVPPTGFLTLKLPQIFQEATELHVKKIWDIFQNTFFCFSTEVIKVWNELKLNNWWQICNFWMNYYFRRSMQTNYLQICKQSSLFEVKWTVNCVFVHTHICVYILYTWLTCRLTVYHKHKIPCCMIDSHRSKTQTHLTRILLVEWLHGHLITHTHTHALYWYCGHISICPCLYWWTSARNPPVHFS